MFSKPGKCSGRVGVTSGSQAAFKQEGHTQCDCVKFLPRSLGITCQLPRSRTLQLGGRKEEKRRSERGAEPSVSSRQNKLTNTCGQQREGRHCSAPRGLLFLLLPLPPSCLLQPSCPPPNNQPKHCFVFEAKKKNNNPKTWPAAIPCLDYFYPAVGYRGSGEAQVASVQLRELKSGPRWNVSSPLGRGRARRKLRRDVSRDQSRTCCTILVGGPANLLTTHAASHADKE